MAIYEYWCDNCQKEFELMRPMSESAAEGACPSCGGAAEKLPSVFASKEGYTIKVPEKSALRQPGHTPAASESE